MGEAKTDNFSSCCRLCLVEEKLDSADNTTTSSCMMRSIFEDAIGGDGVSLRQKISDSLQVEIQSDDKISTMVCTPCIEKVNVWYAYKQACTKNQTKLLQWLNSSQISSQMPDMNISIKEEPVDHDDDAVIVNGDVSITVKNEPVEEYNELPPPLTPQNEGADKVGNAEDLQIRSNGGERNSLECSVCDKVFSSNGNRKKHERIFHGLHLASASGSEIGSLSQDDRSQASSMDDSQSMAEVNAEHPKEPDSEEKKILFAAGLKLLQRNGTPPISLESLSRIELSYIEKCKAMAEMHRTLECACHKVTHPNLKGLLSHLRSLRIWFPVFTCYHCMITLTDRSSSTRHHVRCTRSNLETLVKLSNLRKRSEVKTRLYQNFKCTQCKFMYSFHEDFCTHVDEDHSEITLPYRCTCDRVFLTLEDYKDHAYVSCLVQFYCDICFVTVKSLDAFQKHAAEVHDNSEGFILLQDDNYKPKRVASAPSETSPSTKKESTFSKEATSVENIIEGKRERRMSYYNKSIIDTDEDSESKVVNPMFLKKINGTICPICGKEYSSNNNMMRHYRTHANDGNNLSDSNVGAIDDGSFYGCPDCNEMFPASQWDAHKESHQKKTCEECGKVYQFQSELDQHKTVHLNLKVYRDSKTQSYTLTSPNNSDASIVVLCEICDTMFTSHEQLRVHKLTHETMPALESSVEAENENRKKYSCEECNKTYNGYNGLWEHNRKKHPDRKISLSTFPKQCPHCDKVFSHGASYFMHVQAHNRNSSTPDIEQQPSGFSEEFIPEISPIEEDDDNEDTESYHTCKRCFKVFSTKYNLRNHMKCHGINYASPPGKPALKQKVIKKVWCSICHVQFDNNIALEQHKIEEHTAMPETKIIPNLSGDESSLPIVFTCDVCVQTFSSKMALKKHKEKHAQEKPVANNRPSSVYCRYCKISFSTSDELEDHMEQIHLEFNHNRPRNKDALTEFPCSICKKVFHTRGAMHAHQGWHKRSRPSIVGRVIEEPPIKKIKIEPGEEQPGPSSFRCSACKAVLPNDTALQIHILEKHRNVNAVSLSARCNMCNIDFANQEEYEQHKRFHTLFELRTTTSTVKKSCACSYCPAVFSRSDTLSLHVRQYHRDQIRQQVKQEFKCPHCDRVFDKQSALHIHIKVHEKHTPQFSVPIRAPAITCSICNLGFEQAKDLRAHVFTAHPF